MLLRGELLLIDDGGKAWLVTLANAPTEFVSRWMLDASLGGACFLLGLSLGIGLVERWAVLRGRFLVGPFESPRAIRLMSAALVCFCLWFLLLVIVPAAFD